MSQPDRPTTPPAEDAVGLIEIDPLIAEAANEIDGSLLDWALSLTPRQRLRASTNAERALRKFVYVSPSDR